MVKHQHCIGRMGKGDNKLVIFQQKSKVNLHFSQHCRIAFCKAFFFSFITAMEQQPLLQPPHHQEDIIQIRQQGQCQLLTHPPCQSKILSSFARKPQQQVQAVHCTY